MQQEKIRQEREYLQKMLEDKSKDNSGPGATQELAVACRDLIPRPATFLFCELTSKLSY